MKYKNYYIINFDFEEVNSAVFRNAEIYIRKKNKKDKIGVIVPYQFKVLFSNADIVAASNLILINIGMY